MCDSNGREAQEASDTSATSDGVFREVDASWFPQMAAWGKCMRKRYGLADFRNRGSDGRPFAVQSSVLDEEALLAEVLTDYCIPAPSSCRFLTRGDSDVYRVKTSSGAFYLKVYRPPTSFERVENEALFVSALAGMDIHVVKPVPRKDRHFASQVSAPEGVRPMLLFEEAPPPLPSSLDEPLVVQIGRTVALIHRAGDECEASMGLPDRFGEPLVEDRVYYTSHFLQESDQTYLREVSASLVQPLRQLPREAPDFGPCHSDLVMSNVRLTPEGTVTVFDFGEACKTWRAFELAVVYWSLGNRARECLWPALLSGYQSVQPLPEGFDEHLPLMLVLRQICFLGGNCATLPLRLGTEPFETDFIEKQMARLRRLAEAARLL